MAVLTEGMAADWDRGWAFALLLCPRGLTKAAAAVAQLLPPSWLSWEQNVQPSSSTRLKANTLLTLLQPQREC